MVRGVRLPHIALGVGYLLYAVWAVRTDSSLPSLIGLVRWWLLAPLFMSYAMGGIVAVVAVADMLPSMSRRGWERVVVVTAVGGAVVVLSANRTEFMDWGRTFAAALLGAAATAFLFARAQPGPTPHPGSVFLRRWAWVFAFVTFVAAVDLTVQVGLWAPLRPLHGPYWQALLSGELYILEAYLALHLLLRAKAVPAVLGMALLVAPHVLRSSSQVWWHWWKWMGPAAAMLVVNAMVRSRPGQRQSISASLIDVVAPGNAR